MRTEALAKPMPERSGRSLTLQKTACFRQWRDDLRVVRRGFAGASTNRVPSLRGRSAAAILAAAVLLPGAGCAPERGAAGRADAGGPRVVSLAPSLTEIVCAIGAADALVGRTSSCNYPADVVARTPVVGGFGKPSLEALLRVRPTVVIDVDLDDESQVQAMAEIDIRRLRIPCRRLDDIPAAIRAVGELAGRPADAERLAAEIAGGVAARRLAVASVPAAEKPLVYVEIWCDPIMTAGRDSFVSELVALAGGVNLGDEVDKDYYPVSPEWVLSRDPAVIACLYMSRDGSARSLVMNRSGWQALRAVREGRVCADLNPDVILRPGPRVLEGVEELRLCLASAPASPGGSAGLP